MPLQKVTDREKVIRGSYGFTKGDFADAVELNNTKKLNLKRLISGSCNLEQTPRIITELAHGTRMALKFVIRP